MLLCGRKLRGQERMAIDDREQFFTTSDGPRIHFREYRPSDGENKPAVLCLHGMTRNERDFEVLGPRIARLGHRVIVPSQRGRGMSDWDAKPERYNPAVYAADMLALLDHLGVHKAIFIGTSMGGAITMVSATLAPQRLIAAVLNDVGPEIDPAGLERIRGFVGLEKAARGWEEAAGLCRNINGLAFPNQSDPAFWLSFAKRIFREKGSGRIELDYDPQIRWSLAETSGPRPDLWPVFDALRSIPTLVIRGDITDVLMISTVAEMRRRKPDLTVASVHSVGHAPFMTEPEAWQALEDFLCRIK